MSGVEITLSQDREPSIRVWVPDDVPIVVRPKRSSFCNAYTNSVVEMPGCSPIFCYEEASAVMRKIERARKERK